MKAQIFSMDLLFAITILLIIISAIGFVVIQFTEFHERETNLRDMQIKGQTAANSLVNTPGSEGWEQIEVP